MQTYTIGVMVIVLLLLMGVALFYGRDRSTGIDDFLSARNTTTVPLGIATFIAYAVGAGLLFSPPEAGVTAGLPAVIGYGFAIAIPFLLYMTVAPTIQERMPTGHTVVEYARARYGPWMYGLVMVVAIFYMWVLMTANLTGIAYAVELIADVPIMVTLILIMGATMVYTAYGGLVTSIFTDLIQTILLIPLLVLTVAFVVVQFGGPISLYGQLETGAATELSLTNPAGLEFAVYIIIALLGAEMLNQSLWQRAHAGRDRRSLRVSFGVAAIAVVPLGFLAGLYGVIAVGLELDFAEPAAALPAVVESTFGPALILVFVVLMVLVITSTLDNALTGIVSIFAVDIVPRIDSSMKGDRLLTVSRAITFLIAVVAVAYASTRPSVLFLLLRADLLAAATFVPVLLGLYTPRLREEVAFVAAIAGIVIGVPWFIAENYLYSFSAAMLVSSFISVGGIYLWPGDFDFDELKAIETMEEQ